MSEGLSIYERVFPHENLFIHNKGIVIHGKGLAPASARIPAVNQCKADTGSTIAVLQAILVTLLWSSSWVMIKFGLGNLPALTFAGLRYTLAFLLLLPLLLPRTRRQELARLTWRQLVKLGLLGLIYYALAQGALFLGLAFLPANTLSLVLSLSVVAIALSGRFFLGEQLTRLQWIGVFISIAGAFLYFGAVQVISMIGLWAALFALFSNTASAVMSRSVNRTANISPILVTTVSMGVGAICLLIAGLVTEPLPAFRAIDLLIIFWLAAVNTAVAFTLWNHTLRTLSAAQSGVINNTMLIWIAVLAWVFLGEKPGGVQIAGLITTALGTILVHIIPRRVVEAQTFTESN